MSWMDSWSRPGKHAATPPPLYLTVGDSVPYCHSCGRVISERKKHGASEVKYCSSRCRNSKPGPIDRKIEAAFATLLNGATPESLKDGSAAAEQEKAKLDAFDRKDGKDGKDSKKHKKKNSKSTKGDHRPIIECQIVEEIVFQREKDPEKVYGRRKNRKARFVVEKPEDWKSVDMVDKPDPTPAANANANASTSTSTTQAATSLTSEDDNDTVSESDSEEQEGGIVLEDTKSPTAVDPASLPDTIEYGYGSGKIRPPQHFNDVNGSVGGEKGWAERIDETEDMKAKRREGQRRADEREMVRRAARRGCAFGFVVDGEEERRKCEAVMKGSVVEASFAKGEWGVRWREMV
ncbi:hypothetical protein FB567DRAFT_548429 [Paraphoma chrysanthemicola]|uniref:Uncharacterized protein n=1 Tax=Paraphoma chrysanthemicola TaxID=798071 RepID=A0A8K0R745_9PLEO|nr:hypothetical protein FB567DRAFT_548429 [Paraphoma chrysanthemicola]